MPESFAPSVIIGGKAYTPPGWMWVLSFALSGNESSIKAAGTPAFMAIVRAWHVENERRKASQRRVNTEKLIAEYERRLSELRKDLHIEQN